jgi:hypothetical protein
LEIATMADTKHTEGPWRYREGRDAYTHIVESATGRFLVQFAQDTTGEAEANARLAAAAPELLASLQWAMTAGQLGRLSQARDFVERSAEARDAIAKATALAPPTEQG